MLDDDIEVLLKDYFPLMSRFFLSMGRNNELILFLGMIGMDLEKYDMYVDEDDGYYYAPNGKAGILFSDIWNLVLKNEDKHQQWVEDFNEFIAL